MSDESLREFQLNGKQLVFLFMASTIVAVVIFLCGVMVGRGAGLAQALVNPRSVVDAGDPTEGAVPEPAATLSSTPVDVAPVVPVDDPDLKYPTALTAEDPKLDLEPARTPSKPVVPRAPALVSATAAAPSATVVSAPRPGSAPAEREASTESSSTGFVVQVVATPRRSEAEAIRGRLQSKGYPAFVTTSGKLFRVRVGKYKDRAEATAVSKRLQTEERYKPWVTR